jgi:hypothetical protein
MSNSSSGSKERTFPVAVTGYNHTDKYIDEYSVNGKWAGNLREHGGGGSEVCCLNLPSPWRPGIKVKVSWEVAGKVNVREVEVPQYDAKSAAKINAHFLRGGEVKVFVTRGNIYHPDYPFKGEESYLKPGQPNVSVR